MIGLPGTAELTLKTRRRGRTRHVESLILVERVVAGRGTSLSSGLHVAQYGVEDIVVEHLGTSGRGEHD